MPGLRVYEPFWPSTHLNFVTAQSYLGVKVKGKIRVITELWQIGLNEHLYETRSKIARVSKSVKSFASKKSALSARDLVVR